MAEAGGKGKPQRWWLYGGGAALLCLAAFLLWPREGSVPTPSSASPSGVGIVDVSAAMEAHPAYAALAAAREERRRLEDDLLAERRMLLELAVPRLSDKLFQDAARQKQHQKDVQARQALMERLEAAEKTRREEQKPAYEAARDEINGQYLNEIFNIRLKLDNRDSMRLSDEAVRLLTERLQALQAERGEKQFLLWQKFEAEIQAYRESLAAAWGLELSQESASSREQLLAEEFRQKAEAQSRNSEAIRKNLLDMTERRQRIVEKEAALRAKGQEIAAMEEYMMKDVAGKAAKLAVLHRLSVIFARPAKNIEALPAGLMTHIGAWPPADAAVIGTGAIDLTEELADELKAR